MSEDIKTPPDNITAQGTQQDIFDQLEELEARSEELESKYKKKRFWLCVFIIVFLIADILLAIRIGGKPDDGGIKVIEPDYPVVPPESNAETMEDENTEKFVSEGGGGAVAMTYSDKVTYDMASNTVYLMYGNPNASNHSLILQIIIKHGNNEYLIAQSGTIGAGYRVESLQASVDENVVLYQGVYEGVIRVLFFNPDTGEKAIVNSEIPVKITVT